MLFRFRPARNRHFRISPGRAQDEDGLQIDGDVQKDGKKQVAGEQKKAAESQAGDAGFEHPKLALVDVIDAKNCGCEQ